jgi:hypothetical protein
MRHGRVSVGSLQRANRNCLTSNGSLRKGKHIQFSKHCPYSYLELRTMDTVHKPSDSESVLMYWLLWYAYSLKCEVLKLIIILFCKTEYNNLFRPMSKTANSTPIWYKKPKTRLPDINLTMNTAFLCYYFLRSYILYFLDYLTTFLST